MAAPSIPTLDYYLSLVTSLYRDKPNFIAWLTALLTPINDAMQCAASLDAAFDLDTAIGVQLDILGQIIGVGRTLPFQPSGGQQITGIALNNPGSNYFNGDVLSIDQPGAMGGTITVGKTAGVDFHIQQFSLTGFGEHYNIAANVPTTVISSLHIPHGTGATFDITSVSATVSPTLDDDTYRILLKAKVAQNQWDGHLTSLGPLWSTLFPAGQIIIEDNQNMTATVLLIGAFNSVVKDMITNGLIVPRPEGVLYTYLFALLPIFGFDGDGTIFGGFDEGIWA